MESFWSLLKRISQTISVWRKEHQGTGILHARQRVFAVWQVVQVIALPLLHQAIASRRWSKASNLHQLDSSVSRQFEITTWWNLEKITKFVTMLFFFVSSPNFATFSHINPTLERILPSAPWRVKGVNLGTCQREMTKSPGSLVSFYVLPSFVPFFWTLFSLRENTQLEMVPNHQIHFQHLSTKVYI